MLLTTEAPWCDFTFSRFFRGSEHRKASFLTRAGLFRVEHDVRVCVVTWESVLLCEQSVKSSLSTSISLPGVSCSIFGVLSTSSKNATMALVLSAFSPRSRHRDSALSTSLGGMSSNR